MNNLKYQVSTYSGNTQHFMFNTKEQAEQEYNNHNSKQTYINVLYPFEYEAQTFYYIKGSIGITILNSHGSYLFKHKCNVKNIIDAELKKELIVYFKSELLY
ncbi:MAG: hypothetical protein PHX40_04095 [Bacilli bacterium]|nr:hypothetical protein [Bacilli bacterium]